MAMFDIIEASGYGYQTAWQERRYLWRLARVPLIIKCICVFLILRFDWSALHLKSTLLLLPTYFADGWVFSHYTRLIFLNQRWPFRPAGDEAADRQALAERAHYILAGTLTFALFHFLQGGLMAWIVSLFDAANAYNYDKPPPVLLAMSFLGTAAFGIWFMRLLWFYIPAALGYSLRQCLRDLRGMMTSVLLMVLFLICQVPLTVLQLMIDSPANFDFLHPATQSAAATLYVSVAEATIDTVVGLISTGAVAYAMYEMISLRRGTANGRGPGPRA